MQQTLPLKSTVTRRQPILEPVDADERAAQLQYLDQYCLLLNHVYFETRSFLLTVRKSPVGAAPSPRFPAAAPVAPLA